MNIVAQETNAAEKDGKAEEKGTLDPNNLSISNPPAARRKVKEVVKAKETKEKVPKATSFLLGLEEKGDLV